MSYQPKRPYRGLVKIIAKVCDERGEPYPWNKPPLHVDLPALPDDAGPVETMLAEAAGHRQFMASVASPGPRRPRSLMEIAREVQEKSLRDNLPGRQPDTGRGRGYGR